MPYTPVEQRPIGMKPSPKPNVIDATEILTIPPISRMAMTTEAVIAPPKVIKPMAFEVGAGLIPEVKAAEVKPEITPKPIGLFSWETFKHWVGIGEAPSTLIETIKKVPEKVAWGAILTVPKVRDKYIEQNPSAVIDFADDYEKIVGPFVRTIYPTRIPLAIAEKVMGKKLAATYDELAQKHPFTTAISGLLGDIYNLVTIAQLTGGIGEKIRIPGDIKVLLPALSRYIPSAISAGATFGVKGLLDESISQFEKGKFEPGKIATETGKNFLFGTLLAGPMVSKSISTQVLGSGMVMGGFTAIESYLKDGTLDQNDMLNIGTNTILGMVFASLGVKSRVQKITQQEIYNLAHQRLVVKVGEANALMIEQSHLATELSKIYPEKSVAEIMAMTRLLPKGYVETKLPTVIEQQIKTQLPREFQDFKNLSEAEQTRMLNQSLAIAKDLVSKGEPIWSAILKGLQQIPVGLTIREIKPVEKAPAIELTSAEQKVIDLRNQRLTYEEVGKRLGITAEKTRQLESKALAKGATIEPIEKVIIPKELEPLAVRPKISGSKYVISADRQHVYSQIDLTKDLGEISPESLRGIKEIRLVNKISPIIHKGERGAYYKDGIIELYQGAKKENLLHEIGHHQYYVQGGKNLYSLEGEKFARDYAQTIKEIAPEIRAIPKELEPLAIEARKYKSVEEFVEKINSRDLLNELQNKAVELGRRTSLANAEEQKILTQALKEAGFRPSEAEKLYRKVLDRVLKREYGQTLTDFYSQATKGIKEVKPEIIKPAIVPKIPTIPPRRLIERVTGIRPERRMITKPEDVLLRVRVRAEAAGARVGFRVARTLTREELITKFKSSQTTIRELKEEVINRIKTNLPLEARGRFIQTLERDLTRKRVYGIYERIERISEQIRRREIVEELKEVPKGNIAVDYQRRVEETMRDIDLAKPTERTLRRLESLNEYIQRQGVPLGISTDTLNKLSRLTKKNVSQMTVQELTDLRDTVQTLQQLGKLKLQLKFKYNQRERGIALQRLIASTNNLDPPVTPIMGRIGQWDMAKVQTRRMYMETFHTPRVADMIDGYKAYEGENAKYIKRLGIKETAAKVETQNIVSEVLDEIQALGVKELTPDQQLRMMINIRLREGAHDQVKTLLERNKLTKVPEISDTENQIIEIVRKAVNKTTDEIAAIYEEIENKPFRRLSEYVLPIKYEYEYNIIPSQTIEQGRHRTTQTFKGFVYKRQKGVERMPRTDVLGILEEAINEQQWYVKIQPELENLKYLVRSKEYIEKSGQMAANFWRDYMDVVARRGWSAMAASNPLLRAARINIGRSILGYKLTSVLMQPFSVFDAIAYANTRFGGTVALQIIKEFSKAWINPKYARQIIAESPALRMRKAGEVAVEELAPGLVARPPRGIERRVPPVIRTALRKFQREALTFLQEFDIRTAAGVQKAMENILVKNGIPNAKQEAEFFMNITQGSAEVTYRPLILSRGEGSRTLFTFQTFFLNRWGVIAHDLITSGLIKSRTWGKKFAALIGLAIMIAASVAENEARYAILGLTKKVKKKASAWVAAVMAIPENIPIFGNMISSFVTYGTTDFDFPLARVVENAIGGIGVITKKTPEAKMMAGLRAAESFAELLGIPGSAQFFDFLEGLFGGEEKGPEMMPMPTKREAGRPPLVMPKKLAP